MFIGFIFVKLDLIFVFFLKILEVVFFMVKFIGR